MSQQQQHKQQQKQQGHIKKEENKTNTKQNNHARSINNILAKIDSWRKVPGVGWGGEKGRDK